ncbi:hypothetical protein HN873_004757, partial [Arachis hypogaea]
ERFCFLVLYTTPEAHLRYGQSLFKKLKREGWMLFKPMCFGMAMNLLQENIISRIGTNLVKFIKEVQEAGLYGNFAAILKAMHSFSAESEKELSFSKGDFIVFNIFAEFEIELLGSEGIVNKEDSKF